MLLLVTFAFVGGIVTILSPCILPVLPIILSGTVGRGKRRPIGIIVGFILSFSFFTLFLTAIVNATGLSADFMRTLAVVVLLAFGVSLIIPRVQQWIEMGFSRMASKGPQSQNRTGFGGGVVVGASLGLLWTPCVGPILAAVISLALSESVTGAVAVITVAYALGTAIPMFAIMQGGRALLQKVPGLMKNTGRIQQVFGVLMILTAVAIIFNLDRKFQTYILDVFPNYGTGLTSIEDNDAVRSELDELGGVGVDGSNIGDPMFASSQTSGREAPALIPGGEWFNTEPLTLAELEGEVVVLIDFWTYSCINCIRTQPYLNDWHTKYADQGLVIIGVHTPEFEFEKSADNVQQAIIDADIEYPVVQDNNFATWRAYANRYWPRKYLIDHQGNIIYDHIGEGAYDETEREIQAALKKLHNSEVDMELSQFEDTRPPSNLLLPITPELYFGAFRNTRLANGTPGQTGPQTFTAPATLADDNIYLSGEWNIMDEYAVSQTTNAGIHLKYTARYVYMVLSAPDGPVTVTVTEDGETVNSFVVDEEKLYTVIEHEGYTDGILEITAQQSGLEAYTFTFG